MNCEGIIYLDSDFLSKKFEDTTNEPAMTTLFREEGIQTGLKIPFASGGAHTKEVKVYNISVYGMFKNLQASLKKYSNIQAIDEKMHNKIGWISGEFKIGCHKRTRQVSIVSEEEVLEEGLAFQLENENGGIVMLITKDEYFSSGYENLLNMISPIYLSFESSVKCLLKIVGWNKVLKMAVGIPYIILDKANFVIE